MNAIIKQNPIYYNLQNQNSISELLKVLSQNTNQFLIVALKKFYELFEISPFFASDSEFIAFCKIIDQKYSNKNTVRSYILAMKKICYIGVVEGIMQYNPIKKLEAEGFLRIPSAEKYDNGKPHNAELPKINLILTQSKIPKRIKAIIMFLANTGCRVSELVALTKDRISVSYENIKKEGENIRVYYGNINMYEPKTGRNRILKVPLDKWNYIADNINNFENDYPENKESKYFIHNRYGEKMSRQGVDYLLKKAWNMVFENENIGAHQFRHFFITELLGSGLDLATVSDIVGHKSVNTTAIYNSRKKTSKDFDLTDTAIDNPENIKSPEVVRVVIDRTSEVLEEIYNKKPSRYKKRKSIFRDIADSPIDNTKDDGLNYEPKDAPMTEEEVMEFLKNQD